jgi:hypothetical protein
MMPKPKTVSKEIHPATQPTGVSEEIQILPGLPKRQTNQYSPKVRAEQIKTYLDQLSKHGNNLTAAEAAGVDLRTIQYWRQRSASFATKDSEAKQLGDLRTLRRYETKMDKESLDAPFDKVTSILSMFRTKRLDPAYRDNAITNINVAGPAALQFVVHASEDASKQVTQAEPEASK